VNFTGIPHQRQIFLFLRDFVLKTPASTNFLPSGATFANMTQETGGFTDD